MKNRVYKVTSSTAEQRGMPRNPISRYLRARSKGQALVVVALTMTVLILFVGLGVDVANLMGKKSKLQSATDTSALSAVQILAGSSTFTSTAQVKAMQMLQTNGILTNTLNMSRTFVSFPAPSQISIHAVQHVDTFFMRLIPAFATVDISADATADINSYAEINAKPYGLPGVVNELNLMVWGQASNRTNGDAYDPVNDQDPGNSNAALITNPDHSKLPWGYIFRVDVPRSYANSNSDFTVQLFDPDSYNRPDAPPTFAPSPTPYPPSDPRFGQAPPTPTVLPDMFANCSNTNRDSVKYPYQSPINCTTTLGSSETGLYLKSFQTSQWKRPAFWRVEEYRCPYSNTSCTQYQTSSATTAQFSIWHFDPHITSAFEDPNTLTDTGGPLAVYTSTEATGKGTNNYNGTDLKWFQPEPVSAVGALPEGNSIGSSPTGFKIALNGTSSIPCWNGNTTGPCFAQEINGGYYFYMYVQGITGSSENNYDMRVGPSPASSSNMDCSNPTSGNAQGLGYDDCYINKLYFDQETSSSPPADWNDGGIQLFAKHSLPLNLDTGTNFPAVLTQISKNAAEQVLGVRHFDMDCASSSQGCGYRPNYQMQKCVLINSTYQPCTPLSDDNCWANIIQPNGQPAQGYVSNHDSWTESWPTGNNPDPEHIQIPQEGSSGYTTFFGPNGECSDSWLRMQSYPSFSQDTSVWELPFIRARLIK